MKVDAWNRVKDASHEEMRLFPSIVLAVLLLGSPAFAELTSYEQRTLAECAARLGASPDPDPQPDGKLIERIDIVVLDVFDEHDPVPDFFNVFHAMSRKAVIANELLFREGERYVRARVDESARNLRTLQQQLSLVLAVPLRGSAPGRVRVVVIVKDIWSLRLNNQFSVSSSGGLQTLTLQPSEQNLAGLHTVLAGEFSLRPDTYALGGLIGQRRILGTRLYTALSSAVVYRRTDGEAEGSRGSFVFGDPLRESHQRWAYGVGVVWDDEMTRHLRADGRTFTYDPPSTGAQEAMPVEYRTQRYIGGYEVVRSFGLTHKYDVSAGIEVDRRQYRHRLVPGASARAESAFQAVWVPVSDTRASPFVQLRAHEERYLHTAELETLALEEEYVLGPEVLLRAYPASTKLGSTRNLLGFVTGAAMTFDIGDGMTRFVVQNRLEYEMDGRHDASVVGAAHLASPRSVAGRLILDGLINARYENYLHRTFELGGDTRLRGYPQAGYQGVRKGPLAVALNAEFRTRSVDILSVHSGLAVFYDAGDVTDRLRDVFLRQSAGIGLRFVAPQFDRVVLRADWAFPFNPAHGYRTFPGALFVGYGQAFSPPVLSSPSVMTPDTR
jgi:hypothetical protein